MSLKVDSVCEEEGVFREFCLGVAKVGGLPEDARSQMELNIIQDAEKLGCKERVVNFIQNPLSAILENKDILNDASDILFEISIYLMDYQLMFNPESRKGKFVHHCISLPLALNTHMDLKEDFFLEEDSGKVISSIRDSWNELPSLDGVKNMIDGLAYVFKPMIAEDSVKEHVDKTKIRADKEFRELYIDDLEDFAEIIKEKGSEFSDVSLEREFYQRCGDVTLGILSIVKKDCEKLDVSDRDREKIEELRYSVEEDLSIEGVKCSMNSLMSVFRPILSKQGACKGVLTNSTKSMENAYHGLCI